MRLDRSIPRRSGSIRLAAVALVLLSFAQCRKRAPDEIVYTGRPSTGQPSPTTPAPIPTPPPPPPDEVPPPPKETFSKAALLTAIADCSLERFRAFDGVARALQTAARARRDAPTEANERAARDAWSQAMAVWQEAEIFQIGPAAASPLPGAKDLREQIYAWPSISRCKIEEQLVAEAYARPEFPASLVTARGLAALEYLTFYTGADNACSSFSEINAQGSWSKLGSAEIARRKAAYGAAVADDVAARAAALVAAWDPASGNFHHELAAAGAGSATFARQQDAFNAVNDALFYIEYEAKDLKLGRPLGYVECATPTCPEAIESHYANASTANLKANLAGFRRLFQGCGAKGAGFGFDDWLTEVGAADLASRMVAALVNAQATLDALDPPIERAIVSDPAKVAAVHAALRALTDPLKTEFVTVLNLELPKSSEGDND
jgi:predicted lipoprotein